MKRTLIIAAFLAMGLLVASTFAAAQEVTLPKPYFTGQASIGLLGRSDVSSSKFTEYREVPKGVSIPLFDVVGSQQGVNFALYGQNVRQSDQRFFGYSEFSWFGVAFDYNQIPHNMGFDGRTIESEISPGVWGMSATLRKALGDAVDATPGSNPNLRTYDFYNNLLAPTFAAANHVDITSLRQTGNLEVDLGNKLPFDLAFTYFRDVKTGNRGESSGTMYGVTNTVIDVPDALNEVTQDFGFRFGYAYQKMASFYFNFNRNLYNDRVDSLIVDNPFRATDLAYGGTPAIGGSASARFGTPPDNQANREAFGFQLKFARQTRISGDFAFGQWTQNQQYLPYTIDSAIFTPAGLPANLTSSLQAQSLNGKIDTTMLNFSFSSRPIEGLGVRAKYRSYDLSNKTTPIVWTGSTGVGDPERGWDPPVSPLGPFGFENANPYSNNSKRFDALASYDYKALTVEGSFRTGTLSRTYREATSGDQRGYALAAVYRSTQWANIRFVYDWDHRTANGETVYGFQSDEAERKTTRIGLIAEITPMDKIGFIFSYDRRNDDYPNRPDRVAASGGVPVPGAQPTPNTPSGLLNAKYDEFTVEFDYNPSARAELSAYYTYEKNSAENQWSTTLSASANYAINNLLNYVGSDRGNTFGVNALYHIVPDKWTVTFNLVSQKIDGLMDITANSSGATGCCSFYNARLTLSPPGAQPINDFDDTLLTTIVANLDYHFAKAWTVTGGYWYEKYDFKDAYTSGTSLFPQSPLIFMKANSGPYTANVVYAKLNYRF